MKLFTDEFSEKLQQITHDYESGKFAHSRETDFGSNGEAIDGYLVQLANGLDPCVIATGLLTSSTSAKLCKINTTTRSVSATSITATIYNYSGNNWKTNDYLWAARDPYSGQLVAVANKSACEGTLASPLQPYGTATITVSGTVTNASIVITDIFGWNGSIGKHVFAEYVNQAWRAISIEC